jgi:hypothetical protein
LRADIYWAHRLQQQKQKGKGRRRIIATFAQFYRLAGFPNPKKHEGNDTFPEFGFINRGAVLQCLQSNKYFYSGSYAVQEKPITVLIGMALLRREKKGAATNLATP